MYKWVQGGVFQSATHVDTLEAGTPFYLYLINTIQTGDELCACPRERKVEHHVYFTSKMFKSAKTG